MVMAIISTKYLISNHEIVTEERWFGDTALQVIVVIMISCAFLFLIIIASWYLWKKL